MAVFEFFIISLASYGESTFSSAPDQCVSPAHIPDVELQNETMILKNIRCYLGGCMESGHIEVRIHIQ